MKVLIFPGSAQKERKLASFSVSHPKTGRPSLYFYDLLEDGPLYEIVAFEPQLGSWFIDDSVHEKGSLHLITPVDALYLLLPFLITKHTKYRSLDDILSDTESAQLLQVLNNRCQDLSMVCDFKRVDGDDYFKYNAEKTIAWLEAKVKLVMEALKQKHVNVSSSNAKVAGFLSGDETNSREEGSLTKYAFELIEDYLPEEVAQRLMLHLNISCGKVSENQEQVPSTSGSKKRTLDEVEPTVDYFSKTKTDYALGVDSKRQKPTRAQMQLLKVDKKGMKSISSYFARKAK